MVNANRGVPDPSNSSTNHNLAPNNEIIIATDTDSEEETNNYEGYQPLAGNADEAFSNEESDEEEEEGASGCSAATAGATPKNDLSPITPMEQSLLKEVWGSTVSKDIEMDTSKVDAVKRAMVNITLPDSSIPEWASSVPEEEWKTLLLDRIQNFNKNK